MEKIDIVQLIEAEQVRRQTADTMHVRRLARGGDLGAWCATRRAVVRSVAMVVLLLLPAGWFMLLPQRTDDRQVLCNIPADKPLVVARACSALGNCGDRQVINLMNMK